MTDIIHGSPRALPVDNPFFRWWQSIDQWTLVSSLGLIVTGLLLSMAASIPLADSNDMPAFYYVYRQAFYGIISFSIIKKELFNPLVLNVLPIECAKIEIFFASLRANIGM